MKRNDAIKLTFVLAAIAIAAYGTWRASRWIELRIALSAYTDGYFYPSNAEEIAHLLRMGANPNARDRDGATMLQVAVRKRDMEGVRALLDGGANPALKDARGFRPIDELDYAGNDSYGSLTLAKMLWAHGEDYSIVDAIVARDDAKILSHLRRDPNLAAESFDEFRRRGVTALMAAAAYGSVEIFEALIAAGGDVHAQDEGGTSVAGYAAMREGASKKILPRLLELGAELDVPNRYDMTPLLIAANFHHADEAAFFIQHGADVNRADRDGKTPLMSAVENCPDVVENLIKHGAQLDAKDRNGKTALHTAVSLNIEEMTRLLLDAGANPNVKDNEGRTPIWGIFVNRQGTEIPSMLIEHGADLTVRDPKRNNLIAGASLAPDADQAGWVHSVVRLFLLNGVRLDDVNDAGESARDWILNRITPQDLAALEREVVEAARTGLGSKRGIAQTGPKDDL